MSSSAVRYICDKLSCNVASPCGILSSGQPGLPSASVVSIKTTVRHLWSFCGDRIRTAAPSPASKPQPDRHGLISKEKCDGTTRRGGKERLHRASLRTCLFFPALTLRRSNCHSRNSRRGEENGLPMIDPWHSCMQRAEKDVC